MMNFNKNKHNKKVILLGIPVVSSFVGGVSELMYVWNKKKILSGSARRYLLSLGYFNCSIKIPNLRMFEYQNYCLFSKTRILINYILEYLYKVKQGIIEV